MSRASTSFYGFVGPNGAGKTTTLSMVTGLLRPDAGIVKVYGADVWRNAAVPRSVLLFRSRAHRRQTKCED